MQGLDARGPRHHQPAGSARRAREEHRLQARERRDGIGHADRAAQQQAPARHVHVRLALLLERVDHGEERQLARHRRGQHDHEEEHVGEQLEQDLERLGARLELQLLELEVARGHARHVPPVLLLELGLDQILLVALLLALLGHRAQLGRHRVAELRCLLLLFARIVFVRLHLHLLLLLLLLLLGGGDGRLEVALQLVGRLCRAVEAERRRRRRLALGRSVRHESAARLLALEHVQLVALEEDLAEADAKVAYAHRLQKLDRGVASSQIATHQKIPIDA